MKPHILFSSAIVAGALLLGAQPLWAAPFNYNNGDVLVVFWQAGQPNLEVDIGPVSQFIGATPGSIITFTGSGANQFSLTQLNAAFPSLASVNWAVISDVRGASVYGLPANTLFLTNPRFSLSALTSPYTSLTTFQQGSIGSIISTVAGYLSSEGAIPWSSGTPANAISNTANVVIIPDGDSSSYVSIAGSAGDLAGTFQQGDIENQTPSPFTSGATRSDFYELKPNTGAGVYLGYFEFDANGTLTFRVAPTLPTAYNLQISQPNVVLNFSSENNVLYDVQADNDLVNGSWSTIASNLTGTGGTLTYTDPGVASQTQRFYRIHVQF
jgi:hypothetical protein